MPRIVNHDELRRESDQVNNALGFPSIFRGALDVRACRINEEMKCAAVMTLVEVARRVEAVRQIVRDAHPSYWERPDPGPASRVPTRPSKPRSRKSMS